MKKWRCTVCGQEFEGDAPPVPCPVCGAGAEAFEEVKRAADVKWRCTVCGQVFDGDSPPVPCPVCGAGAEAFERVETAAQTFRQDTDDAFVLVGGGLAALEAAKAIRARNKTASITMVCGEDHPPYNRPGLSDVVADGLSFVNLLLEEPPYYEENNITLLTGSRVESIDPSAKTVHLADGIALDYTRLLLATGANPFNPVQSGPNAIPVRSLRCYEDATELVQQAKGCRIVLVGGGILGLEAAVALHGRGASVTVVELAERVLPIQTDETASARLRARLEEMGITILTGVSVASAEQDGVVLADGRTLDADMVLASLGVRSEVSLAVTLGLELSRGIVVDDFMHTSHPDIWAAGDCAEYGGRVLAMAGAAAGMGAVAGASMAGDESAPYRPFIPATTFSLPGGFSLFSMGAVGGDEWAGYENDHTGAYRRLFFQRGALAGAVYLGDNPGAKMMHALAEGSPVARALELLG